LLLVLHSQLLVFLLLCMILQLELNLGFLSQSLNQLWVDDNIGDITLFKHDAIVSKLPVQLIHHGDGHV